VTARPVPARHWRSYGDDPLPSGQEIGMLFTVWWLHRTGMLRSSADAGS
jgi:hypothetical protein